MVSLKDAYVKTKDHHEKVLAMQDEARKMRAVRTNATIPLPRMVRLVSCYDNKHEWVFLFTPCLPGGHNSRIPYIGPGYDLVDKKTGETTSLGSGGSMGYSLKNATRIDPAIFQDL